MLKKTFRGGIRPYDGKEYLQDYVHVVYEPSGEMVFPLPPKGGKALVAPGDRVLVGQKIAESPGDPARNVYCSCSGTVKTVERRPTAEGETVCITVENDRRFQPAEGIGAPADYQSLTREEILRRIAEAGIPGIPDRADISRVAADATDWEPFVTCESDLVRTRGYGIAAGLRVLLRLYPGAEGVILIGDDNTKAIADMEEALGAGAGMRVCPVPAGVAPGREDRILRLISGQKTASRPQRGGLLVKSAAEIYAVYEAVCLSTPFFRRIVTVAGPAVKNPGNFLVRTGTACAELLSAAGGVRKGVTVRKAVLGGAMTGTALSGLDVPVQKDSGALLLFAEDAAEIPEKTATECIRCGRCAKACPAGLQPMLLAKAAEKCDIAKYRKLCGGECILCGACEWACPAKRPLTELFRYAGGLLGTGQK